VEYFALHSLATARQKLAESVAAYEPYRPVSESVQALFLCFFDIRDPHA
jgi:hypothetical protein